MRRALLAAAVLTAISCTPKNPPSQPAPVNPPGAPPAPPAPPPAPPPSQQQTIRLGPSALLYVINQIIQIDQKFHGMRQPLNFELRSCFSKTITGPAETSGYPSTIT